MRVAIVNDLKIATETLRRAVISDSQHTVAWTASDGAEAIRKCQSDRPDVILMDLIMPGLDGAQTTKEIMKQSPCPILVVTATVSGNYSLVYDALGFGAYDAVNTPTLKPDGTVEGGKELLNKIARVKCTLAERAPTTAHTNSSNNTPTRPAESNLNYVLLGASTGGPQAILTILQQLGALPQTSIWIAQHIGNEFATGLTEWLSQRVGSSVRIAKPQDSIEQVGTFLLPSEPLLIVGPNRRLVTTRTIGNVVHTPDINRFFSSLASSGIRPGIAALLTGMGSDGAQGLLELRQCGWYTLAQDQTTSTVYGMPQVAKQIGAAHQVLPLNLIGSTIRSSIQNMRA